MDRIESLKAFASEVAILKFRAGNLGLIKTMQALEAAVTAVGYELAEKIEKSQKRRAGRKG